MSGIRIPLIRLIPFDFDNVENGETVAVIMRKEVDIRPWTTVMLGVRVHEANIVDSSDTPFITVKAKNIDQTVEDPSQTFVGATLASIAVGKTTSAPSLILDTFSAQAAAVEISIEGSTTRYTTSLTASLSVFLICKRDRD